MENNGSVEATDRAGITPAHAAAKSGNVEITVMLVRRIVSNLSSGSKSASGSASAAGSSRVNIRDNKLVKSVLSAGPPAVSSAIATVPSSGSRNSAPNKIIGMSYLQLTFVCMTNVPQSTDSSKRPPWLYVSLVNKDKKQLEDIHVISNPGRWVVT